MNMGNDDAFISRRGTLPQQSPLFQQPFPTACPCKRGQSNVECARVVPTCAHLSSGPGRMPKLRLGYQGPELSHSPAKEDTSSSHAGPRA